MMSGTVVSSPILLVSFPGDVDFWKMTSRVVKNREVVRIKLLTHRFLSTTLRALGKGIRWQAAVVSSAVPSAGIPMTTIGRCAERLVVVTVEPKRAASTPTQAHRGRLRGEVRRLREALDSAENRSV